MMAKSRALVGIWVASMIFTSVLGSLSQEEEAALLDIDARSKGDIHQRAMCVTTWSTARRAQKHFKLQLSPCLGRYFWIALGKCSDQSCDKDTVADWTGQALWSNL